VRQAYHAAEGSAMDVAGFVSPLRRRRRDQPGARWHRTSRP
jgi:hypothetical protein